ncbi:hypothetical protein CDG81_21150 [Actinopolyspora erythraea]|uniref:Uncharacterized protein n=1 Tax=Actinopolyspora erythraea TaxID=414996 RepID=A0A099DB34_9ACTN|nr:hypothetical protein [Actinopolyspora erythraea]ASU80359.1 hypothetical protein CDG81_21150 [Actinopolyspora erythraea]KGI82560.1 hypothetical protein IL38_03730 [Actinopolyspora erythraea]
MDGSLDVRKFLALQDRASPRSSAAVPAPRNGDSGGLTAEQLHSARLAVARGARDREDCMRLLAMLGLADEEGGESTPES